MPTLLPLAKGTHDRDLCQTLNLSGRLSTQTPLAETYIRGLDGIKFPGETSPALCTWLTGAVCNATARFWAQASKQFLGRLVYLMCCMHGACLPPMETCLTALITDGTSLVQQIHPLTGWRPSCHSENNFQHLAGGLQRGPRTPCAQA